MNQIRMIKKRNKMSYNILVYMTIDPWDYPEDCDLPEKTAGDLKQG